MSRDKGPFTADTKPIHIRSVITSIALIIGAMVLWIAFKI